MASEKFEFEKAMNELSEIVSKLENGDVSLEDSISLFERGVYLSRECNKTLESARQKIVLLSDAQEKSENND